MKKTDIKRLEDLEKEIKEIDSKLRKISKETNKLEDEYNELCIKKRLLKGEILQIKTTIAAYKVGDTFVHNNGRVISLYKITRIDKEIIYMTQYDYRDRYGYSVSINCPADITLLESTDDREIKKISKSEYNQILKNIQNLDSEKLFSKK